MTKKQRQGKQSPGQLLCAECLGRTAHLAAKPACARFPDLSADKLSSITDSKGRSGTVIARVTDATYWLIAAAVELRHFAQSRRWHVRPKLAGS